MTFEEIKNEFKKLVNLLNSALQSYLLKDGYLMAIVNDKGSLQYLGTKTAVMKLKMEELKKYE